MRKILVYHILPFFLSIAGLFAFLKLNGDKKVVASTPSTSTTASILTSPNTILLLGSSELSGGDPNNCKPYNFIAQNGKYSCVGLGSAGFQSMAMLAKLYPYSNHLKDAKITIIVSPGWFQDDYAYGTSTNIMLEYMNANEFNACLPKDGSSDKYASAIAQWTQHHFHDINNAVTELKSLYYASYSTWIRNSLLAVPQYANTLSAELKTIFFEKLQNSVEKGTYYHPPKSIDKNKYSKALDSLNHLVLSAMKENNNNPLGVEDTIFESEYKGKTKNIRNVPQRVNRELNDFELLLGFLKEQKANVKLVVQSLHPMVYANLKELNDEMKEVMRIIKASEFTTLNMYTTDPSQYDTKLLRDAMHMSDYGWLRVNEFIIKEYGLEK